MTTDRSQSIAVRPRHVVAAAALSLLTLAIMLAVAGSTLATRELTVTVAPIAPATDNTTADFNITVNNTGDQNAGGVDVQLYVDGAPLGATVNVGAVQGGQNKTVTASRSLVCGSRVLNATVDPADAIAETDETNNNFTLPLNVLPYLTFTSNLSGTVGAYNMTLNATGSHGCEPLTFSWNVSGLVKTGLEVVYAAPGGNVTVTLTGVGNDTNFTNTFTDVVVVANVGPSLTAALINNTVKTSTPIYLTVTGTDPDGFVEFYFIDFGNGNNTNVTADAVTFEYPRPGNYTITVRITDNAGATNQTTLNITVTNQAPDVVTSFPQWVANPGVSIQFGIARAVDPEGGALNFSWDFGDGSTSIDPAPSHAYANPGSYTVNLTVTDPDGGVTKKSIAVTIPAASTGGDMLPLVGGIIVVLLVLGLLVFFVMRRGKKDDKPTYPEKQDTSGKPPSP